MGVIDINGCICKIFHACFARVLSSTLLCKIKIPGYATAFLTSSRPAELSSKAIGTQYLFVMSTVEIQTALGLYQTLLIIEVSLVWR